MTMRLFCVLFVSLSYLIIAPAQSAQAKSYIAYISDSTSSSVIYWLAKEVGIFKKHGLDLDTIFINGSVRGIQSLIAGDLGYSGAVGTAVINANLGSRNRHYSESDEHLALLHHRQCEHQVPRRIARTSSGGAHSGDVGGFRHETRAVEGGHSLQRH